MLLHIHLLMLLDTSSVMFLESSGVSVLTLSTGDPQGCVLSPPLYARYMHDCVATRGSNTTLKFAEDTTILGLITNNDETAYREEVRDVATWCPGNSLSLNVCKTKTDCGLQEATVGQGS